MTIAEYKDMLKYCEEADAKIQAQDRRSFIYKLLTVSEWFKAQETQEARYWKQRADIDAKWAREKNKN